MDGEVTTEPAKPHTTARSNLTAVLLLVVLGFGLRLLVTRSIWLDEAISIRQAQLPFHEMITQLAGDVHPPLHHAVLWATVRLLGTGELAVRLPSIVAGTLLIPALYGAGRDLYDRRVGLVAATFGTVAPIAIWYSQEARMYAMFMLFSLIAVWAQVRVLRRGRPGAWAVYSIATAAMIWTQYFALLQVIIQQATFAISFWRRRRGRRWWLALGWAASMVVIVALLVPLRPVFESQLQSYLEHSAGLALPAQAGLGATQQQDQSRLSVYAFIANVIWGLWGYHADNTMAQIVAMWPLGMLLILVLLGRGYSPMSMLLLSVAAVPALILFGVGMVQRNLFELRYFVGAVPVGLLLMARLASSTENRGPRRLIVALVVVTLVVGLADQQLNGANPRLYDFRGALALVAARARPGDVVIYEPEFIGPVVDYYAADLDATPVSAGLSLPQHGQRVFVVGSFLDDPSSAAEIGNALHQLSQHGRRAEEFHRPNVDVWVFQ
jgi:uncharacterized membrane protein